MDIARLYKILGYLGAIPFVIFFLGVLLDDYILEGAFETAQLSYGALILSFLSGVHWPLALKQNDKRRLLLSMLPTILGLVLIIVNIIGVYFYPLCILSLLFWFQFFFDKKYYAEDDFPNNYLVFRLKITSIVSLLLFLTALASL